MSELSIAIIGSGGHGVVTLGQLLFSLSARHGLFGLMRKSYGAQIRGGESAALLRISDQPVECPGDYFDALLALDWDNAERFADEIPLTSGSLVLYDEKAGEPPTFIQDCEKLFPLPLSNCLKQLKGGRLNMVAFGLLVKWLGFSATEAARLLDVQFAKKGAEALTLSHEAFQQGFSLYIDLPWCDAPFPDDSGERWQVTGNEAAGLGALRGGVRFVAAYPITPATDLLEWMAPRLEQLGGTLLQAEDELASINAIIGASWGGTPAMTATSGPGLGLMIEGLGLAVASETPVVVVDVMRGGPSTGIPTKSEQTDLNIALHGLHGDAPHLVLAPLGIGDAVLTTQWAVQLSETLQTPAIVLSDQFIGQSISITRRPPDVSFIGRRKVLDYGEKPYQRYALTADGISPMAIPGTPGAMYTADGLEHDERGKPSSRASDHVEQLHKRRNKLEGHDYGEHWGEQWGDKNAPLALVTWGSSYGACLEAAQRLSASGGGVKVVAPRLLMPLPVDSIKSAIAGSDRVVVVEQNESAQLFHYLLSQQAIPNTSLSLPIPGPLALTPGVVMRNLERMG